MKTKIQLAAMIATFCAFQSNAQNKTIISTNNSDISDNLDLTAVSSIFGESQDLNDFERRLNDPKLQISNLDLNNDNRVDYLRVIESVESNTHVVVIQSVLGRDLYQDVATIEVERDRQSQVSIQIVGNTFLYGQNYIYEPVYVNTPKIYTTFWVSYYRPYYSTWTWNVYPSFYVAWNPYPIYRYRQNVYGCVNYRNTYTYVNYRKCYRAPAIYNSYSCNTYERRNPEYAFSRRNSNYSNHYEMNKKRYATNNEYRNTVAYSKNNTSNSREYTQNRSNSSRASNSTIIEYKKEKTENKTNSPRVTNSDNIDQRDYSQNRSSIPREGSVQRNEPKKEFNQSRENYSRENYTKKEYSQNTNNTSRDNNPQGTQSSRDNSQNRISTSRESNNQKPEKKENNSYTSRSNNRRI
jgi:hypothetical protein